MSTPTANIDPAKVLQFITVSSVLGKRACDQITEKEAAEKRAADLVPDLLKVMLDAGVIGEHQKAAAEAALGDHAQSLHLLKNAVTKLASFKGQGKVAGDRLGAGVDSEKAGTDSQPASYDSLRSPFVGARTGTGVKKASDLAFAAGLGVNLG